MTASLRWDGVVSPLWAYLPIADRRMAGGLHLAADISGTLSQPKIDANVELSNAAFEDLALGILLKNINARAAYTDQGGGTKRDAGRQASLALSGEDGQGGTIRLDGSLDLTARSMQASLNMNKLKPLRRQDLRISLSGDGLVMGTLEAPFVNANITVNEGEFSLAHLPSGGIRELPISSGEETETPPPRGVLSVSIDVPRRFSCADGDWKANGRGICISAARSTLRASSAPLMWYAAISNCSTGILPFPKAAFSLPGPKRLTRVWISS